MLTRAVALSLRNLSRESFAAAMPTTSTVPAVETDRQLLAEAAAGGERALGALYDRYSVALFGLALRIAGERADAEEIVVETFAQAWRDAGRFASDRGSVIAWLTVICRSRALDLVRARGRRARTESTAAIVTPGNAPTMGTPAERPDRHVEDAERASRVREALETLSPPQRTAVELAFFDGLSHTEIAERLDEPLGTVKTRVRLAMAKLRDALRPYYYEAPA